MPTTKRVTARENVASVSKANGAYLVGLHGSATDDCTPDQLYDAASSLARAKQVAVAGARSLGYEGAVRWSQDDDHPSLWWLEMTYVDEWEAYGDDE
jgi:hypothetical protein